MELKSSWDSGRLPDLIGLLVRLILGVVLLVAGGAKITSPASSPGSPRSWAAC